MKVSFKFIFNTVCFLSLTSCLDMSQLEKSKEIKDSSILLLQIKGLILSDLSQNFAKHVRKYASQERVKGVLIRVDSPGGSVAASQEINSAIFEIVDRYKKPVYVSGGDVVASGGVYSIMSASKIFVNAGTLFGSIGVISTFRNLSELARWAKVEIYNLKAGEFKDAGNSFRKMTFRERELFENLLETVHDQFKQAVITGRKLDPEAVEFFADGRIFSGAEGVEFGLADQVGTFNDAIREIGEKTGLGSNPTLFDPDEKTSFERFFENFSSKGKVFSSFFSKWNELESLSGKPLYLLQTYVTH